MNTESMLYRREHLGFTLDLHQSGLDLAAFMGLQSQTAQAHVEMGRIESGAIKNLDEGRAVTHFTERRDYPDSAAFADVEEFFTKVRSGAITGSTGKPFDAIIVNGIGGSALGPQLLQFAIHGPCWNEQSRDQRQGGLRVYFTDNTDAAGLQDALAVIELDSTLVVSISKSGGTRETRNNMQALEQCYAAAGICFAAHALAVTMPGSKLDAYAASAGWLKVWPMAESIGGRTSETAIVGHVPAAAAGIDFRALLRGACLMDEWTREPAVLNNPAYALATAWYLLGNGRGDRNMVIVPYADRLVLLSRYLQQLVMESLGKEQDRDGNTVYQGITVYGNKGGTDAHAFIQQLNDGRDDFFVTFIEVLKDPAFYELDAHLSMGDYLHNFLQGLSGALAAKGRRVLRITLTELNAEAVGLLIALYERAVAFYAELININAFHQPGVEAYKKISEAINELSGQIQSFIAAHAGFIGDAAALAMALEVPDKAMAVEGILAKYAVNERVFGGNRLCRRFTTDGRWHYEISG